VTHDFACIPTGIGSLPIVDPDRAAALILQYLPEAPIWPQLPRRDFREQMDCQYTEALPGARVDPGKKHVFFETAGDQSAAYERFFERYLEKDYGFFGISAAYAAGLPGLLRALAGGVPPRTRFLKGHITGPLTFGTSLKDENGRDIIHDEQLFDAAVKGLAMKAAWQIRTLGALGKPVIIFLDEPAMESLGSAFSAVSGEVVAEKLNEIVDTIHELGGIAGIHCCGNADWPLLFGTRVDIVNFDAFGYVDRVLLYPREIAAFHERGGALAWGIVPTGAAVGTETADQLIARLEAGIRRLAPAGLDRAALLRRSLLTPSCGMGSLSPDQAEGVLRLLREVSDRMQAQV
jgi:hypothetical protein